MPANATLVAHGGIRRTRDELSTLPTPFPTTTWRPVPHADLVAEIIRGLDRQGVTVTRDEYVTAGRDDARLFGVMDLRIAGLDTGDFCMALGLRGGNDRSMAIRVIAAVRVFVCSNLQMSGGDGSVVLRKKHTSGLDLSGIVPGAVAAFLEKAEVFRADLGRMRNFALSDARAKELIHDAFTGPAPVLPIRLMPMVSRLYLEDERQRAMFNDRSLWSLSNGFTEAVKVLKDVPRHEAGLRIGRYFGRVLHRRRPEPYAVVDGIEIYN